MGTDSMHAPKGSKIVDIVRGDLGLNMEIVAHGTARGESPWTGEGYFAIKNLDTNEVTALVVLYRRVRNAYFSLDTKWMDEESGPNAVKCPRKVLNALTPTTNDLAMDWRTRVEVWHRGQDMVKGVKAGDVLTFSRKFDFGLGTTDEDTFTFLRDDIFRAKSTNQTVRLPHWKSRYTIKSVAKVA